MSGYEYVCVKIVKTWIPGNAYLRGQEGDALGQESYFVPSVIGAEFSFKQIQVKYPSLIVCLMGVREYDLGGRYIINPELSAQPNEEGDRS